MVLLLSGPVHGGKTTFLEGSVLRWKARGLSCSGFLSPSMVDGNGERGYDLIDLRTGRRRPYLRRRGETGADGPGPYLFVPGALEVARSILLEPGRPDLLVVDELGPLELRGEGLWPALRDAVRRPDGTVLLVVREDILQAAAAALAPLVPVAFDIRDPDDRNLLDERVLSGIKPDDGQS